MGIDSKPTITYDDLLLQTFDRKASNSGFRSRRAIEQPPSVDAAESVDKPLDADNNKPEIIYLFGDNTNIKNIPYFFPRSEPQENCGEIGAKVIEMNN